MRLSCARGRPGRDACESGLIRGAQRDPNVNFPYQRLRELAAEGVIGELAPTAYSFVGAAAQLRLQKDCLPDWGLLCQNQGLDGLILVPV